MTGKQVLVGLGLGMASAFMLDPSRGRRRRALASDRVTRASRRTREAIDATMRDMSNRTKGIVAATRGRLVNENVDDRILVERVRARLGRACSHPRAIDVEARGGDVTLRGPVLASEVTDLIAVAAAVRGVHSVTNALEPHDSAEGVPSLQGAGQKAGPTLDILQRTWAPGTQALVAAAGLAATGVCLAAYARR